MNGLAPATPGTVSTLGRTPFHSLKSLEYLSSSACALVPRILRLRSASNPLITESTTVKAQTPTETPATEIAVITTVAGRLRRCPGCNLERRERYSIQRAMPNKAPTIAATEISDAPGASLKAPKPIPPPSGRYPRPTKLRANPATRNPTASNPNEISVSVSREKTVAEPSQVASPYCIADAIRKRTNAAAVTRQRNFPFTGDPLPV